MSEIRTINANEIIKNSILNGIPFKATSPLGSSRIKIKKLVPYIIVCQHSGTFISQNILDKMSITKSQRRYEEDLYLDRLFNNQPITIFANHSRFEFDTNRPKESALYLNKELCWGLEVYKEELNQKEKAQILLRYNEFYAVIDFIIPLIIETFGQCIIYDIHSFNASYPERISRTLPTFNLGTMAIDRNRYSKAIDHFLEELNNIKISGIKGEAKENDIFGGRGGLAKYISQNYDNTIIFPIEIRKFFMNEQTFKIYDDVMIKLKTGLNKAILNNKNYFINNKKHFNI